MTVRIKNLKTAILKFQETKRIHLVCGGRVVLMSQKYVMTPSGPVEGQRSLLNERISL